jgi:hypothetical protein
VRTLREARLGWNVCAAVLLQPMKEDPEEGAKCKDKFLVQSAAITGELEALGIAEIVSFRRSRPASEYSIRVQWSALELHRENIKEIKIRCAYLPPVDANGYTPTETQFATNGSPLNDGSHHQVRRLPARARGKLIDCRAVQRPPK